MIISSFKTWLTSIFESLTKYEYGCVMLYFNFPQLIDLHNKIYKSDIYIDPKDTSFGLEKEPHITLLYGFHNDVDPSDVLKICKSENYGELELYNVSCFHNKDYDVLKLDVNSEALYKINSILCKKFNGKYTTSFPDYHPHSTIAYIKKGRGQYYIDLFKNLKLLAKPNKLVYSMPSGETRELSL
jgi:hypothetical protein